MGLFGELFGGRKRKDEIADPSPFARMKKGEEVADFQRQSMGKGRLNSDVKDLIARANVSTYYKNVTSEYSFLETFVPLKIRQDYGLIPNSIEPLREIYALLLRSFSDPTLETYIEKMSVETRFKVLEVILSMMDIDNPETIKFLNAYPDTFQKFGKYFPNASID